jgi:GTP-binding protein
VKFVDQVRIKVKAGDGGNGSVAFRREKFIEKGGPSGGDGGNGGSVVFVVDPQRTTLLDFRFQQHHSARNGQHGMGSDCNGKNAEDLVLPVPVGTLVKDEATGEVLADLSEPGRRYVAAKGGRGGLGNMNFATSTRQTPRFAQPGTLGVERALVLELKLLADVGLLGFPNAGKSTLISVISHAKPRIADYPFTTLVPNLGVVPYKDDLSFVVADIPGLIEGAHEGAGLGHQFLRHVDRCRLLVHLVDLSAGPEARDPVRDFDVLNRELQKHSPELARKPQLVVATKLDLPHAEEAFGDFRAKLRRRGIGVLPLSSATREGVPALLDACARVLFAATQSALSLQAADGTPLLVTAEAALGVRKVIRKVIRKVSGPAAKASPRAEVGRPVAGASAKPPSARRSPTASRPTRQAPAKRSSTKAPSAQRPSTRKAAQKSRGAGSGAKASARTRSSPSAKKAAPTSRRPAR